MATKKIFKECPMCGVVWEERIQFLQDNSLLFNGYKADFKKLEHGLFYFTHTVDNCYSTMVVEAGEFFDLNQGRRYTGQKAGTEDCPGYCLEKEQLDRCDVRCECAFVRDIIDIIRQMKKE